MNVSEDISNTKGTIRSGDLETITVIPTPRKRGGPRKSNSDIDISALTPRKRGRPRKENSKIRRTKLGA